MEIYKLVNDIANIQSCIDAITMLLMHRATHGLDNELLEEERNELMRAADDHAREFQASCVKQCAALVKTK